MTVPNRRPCPPMVLTPPITDAATALSSYPVPAFMVPIPLWAVSIRPTTPASNELNTYTFVSASTTFTPESLAAS